MNQTASSVLASLRSHFRAPVAVLMLGALMLSQVQSVNAATLYWDTNSTTAGSGAATGTWGTSTFWSTDSTGASATANTATTNADDLFFSAGTNGTTGTVTVAASTTQLAHSITFDDPVAITVSGGTAINLGNATAGSGFFFTANAANTISTAIILNSAATALNFTNSGTSLQAISSGITSGGGAQTLTLGASNTGGLNLSGVIGNGSGTVSLEINSPGSGFTILGATNTFTGNSTITAGRVVINQDRSLGGGTALTIAGGILDSAVTTNRTLSNNPILTWSGNFSFGGQAVINGAMGSRNLNLGTGTVTMTADRTVTVDTNTGIAARAASYNLLTVGGQVQGAFRLTKSGLGTLSLSNTTAAGAFNGGVALNAGALRLAGDGSAITNNNITFNGGVLEFAYAPSATYTLGTAAGQFDLTNGGGFSASGGGRAVTLAGGAITWGTTSNFVGASNALKFGSLTSDNSLTLTNAIDLGGTSRTIDATRGTGLGINDAILSGAITNGSIIKTGNGSVALTNVGGTLSAVTISGGALALSTIANLNIQLNGGVYRSGADYTGALGSSNGQIRFAGGAADGGFSADTTANRTLNIGGAGATLTWNSTANFLGTGALLLNSSASSNTTIVANGLDFNGADRTIYVEDGNTGIDARIDGVISGTGGLIKTGGGIGGGARLFLTGANTYTGATTIRNGEVLINSSVLNNTASPFGNSSSTIFITDASTLSADSGTVGGFVALYAQGVNNAQTATAVGDSQQITIARPIDLSGANTTNVLGRTRIGLFGNGGAGLDMNKLTLAGNIALGGRQLELYAERAGQTIEITSTSFTGSGTVYLTGNIGNNSTTDGRSNGTFRFSNQARTFSTGISVTYGTLVIEGSVAASGNSPIGTGTPSLGDGNGGNILQGSGRDAVRGIFLETAGASFDRSLSPAGFGTVTPSATAGSPTQSSLYGTGGTNLGNGYRFGGLNASGTVTFTANIAGQGVNQSVTGTAGGSGGTNALSVVHNIALIAATGGTVNITGAITGSTAPSLGLTGTPGAASSTGNMTRITINQFRNHPNLDEDINGQADAGIANALVGTATAGTVRMSGSNTYGGSTEILGGTLQLNYATNNNTKLADAAALILSGGTVDISGGSHTEVVGSTTITGNTTNSISRSNSTGSGTSTLRLNTLNRGLGGFLNFGAASIADTDTLNTSGILGAWATIGGTDFAQNSTNAADGLITAYTGYTDVARLNGASQVIADGAITNVRLIESTGTAANITLGAATTTINTLNQSASGGTSAAIIDPAGQTLRTNGILVGTGAGGLTLGTGTNNGTLTSATSAAGSELILQNLTSSGLTINSVIADNTTPGNLTVGGTGATTFTGANTYTGSTLVSSGVLNIRNATALGSVSASVTSSTPAVTALAPGNVGQAIINTASTNGLSVGQAISGPGIPAGSFITAVVANTSFTVSQNLTSAASTVTGAYQVGGTTVANGAALELQGGIAVGAEALTLGGSGISNGGALRNISGNNSYAGAITLTADTRINSDTVGDTLTLSGGIPSASTPTSAYALTFGGAGNTVVSGAVVISPSASGYLSSLTKDGAGALTLSGVNTYAGGTNLNAGTLNINSTTALGAGASTLTINGGTIDNSSAGAITLANNNQVTVNADINFTGTQNLNVGTGLVSLGTTAGLARTITTAANTLTLGGVISNGTTANAIVKAGAGTLALTGANTFTGGSTLNAGILQVGSSSVGAVGAITSGPVGTGLLTLNGGTFSSTSTTARSILNSVTVGGDLTLGDTTNNGKLTFSANVDLGAATRVLTTPSAVQFDGIISNGGLSKTGTGTVTLTGANTYDGVTTITTGVVAISNNTALGSTVGNTVINSNGTVTTGGQLSLSNNITINENITIQGTGDGAQFADAITASAGTNTISGSITVTGTNTYRIGASGATTVLNVGLITRSTVSGGGLTLDPSVGSILNINTAIDNNGGDITNHAGGTVVLNASNNDIGNVFIQNSTSLKLGANDALNTTKSVLLGQSTVNTATGAGNDVASLILAGVNQTIGALNGAPNAGTAPNNASTSDKRKITNSVASTTSTLTVGNGNATGAFDGVIENGTGTVAFTKVGTASQTLSGTVANTYTGVTTVTGGSLILAKTAGINAIGGNLTIGDGATTAGNDIVQLTNSNQIADTSVVTFNGTGANAGILRLNNQSETLGGLSSTGGAGIVENNNASAGTSTLTATVASGTQTFSGVLRNNSGTGSGILALTKDGAGTQVLTGTNTYTGATTVSGGTLQIGSAGVGSTLAGSTVTATSATFTSPTTGAGINSANTVVTNQKVVTGAPAVAGTGTINGNLVLGASVSSVGVLLPGDSAGSSNGLLNVGGTLTVNNGSQIQLGLSSSSVNDSAFQASGLSALSYLTTHFNSGSPDATYNTIYKNAGTGYDSIKVTGALNLGTGGTDYPTILVSNVSGTYNAGDVFKLFDWSTVGSTDSIKGAGGFNLTTDLVLPNISGNGLIWDTTAFATYGVVVVVPEPSRVILLFVGLATLFMRRRRS